MHHYMISSISLFEFSIDSPPVLQPNQNRPGDHDYALSDAWLSLFLLIMLLVVH